MKKINVAGTTATISGSILWGYVELSNFMGESSNLTGYAKQDNGKSHKSLYETLPEGNFDWLESITWEPLHDSISYVANMPLWLLLLIIGVLLLVIGGIFIKK
jgi:hypothetical protein